MENEVYANLRVFAEEAIQLDFEWGLEPTLQEKATCAN